MRGSASDHRPRPREIASGVALGLDASAEALPAAAPGDPRVALQAVLLRALRRPPCLVSFSGGRDSSAVLAAAAAVARQQGLALPVPVTYRFAAVAEADERRWQERVVTHLGLADWERVAIASELDVLGPAAQDVMLRLGLLWPFNVHAHLPLLRRARGGTLLTGIGGDELLGPSTWANALGVLRARRAPRPRDLGSLGVALAPLALRRRVQRRRHPLRIPWCRPEVEAAIAAEWADWRARDPLAWNRQVARYWRSRHRTGLTTSLALLAADSGAQGVHPFLDARVVAATARRFGARGPADRTAAMLRLFGDLLPFDVSARGTKARFDEVFLTERSRAFAAGWDGGGVDTSLVDPERLAREWRGPRPSARSLLLMQSAWLATRP